MFDKNDKFLIKELVLNDTVNKITGKRGLLFEYEGMIIQNGDLLLE